MSTAAYNWLVGGTPTSAFSAKLSDPTGTFGARRTDTLTAVVADGADMTEGATPGQYTYDLGTNFVELEYYVEIVDESGDEPIYIHRTVPADGAGGTESTLSINRTQLREEVANFLGINTSSGSWGSRNTDRINRIVANGERMFYQPPKLPGENSIHTWSFLNTVGSIPLVASTADYTMPADFSYFIDPTLHFAAADNAWHDVAEVPVAKILHERQLDVSSVATTYPTMYALTPATTDQSTGQRFKVMVYPTPTAAGTLRGLYKVNPFSITSSDPYPLGGQPHAETLRSAVLAAAELDKMQARGDLYARFLEKMVDSVALDRKQSTPKLFGYNRDRSGPCSDDLPWNQRRVGTVTYPVAWGS